MIIVKNSKIFLNLLLVSYDPLLISIMKYIDKKYGKVVITSGFRKGDKGVHGTIPCRGMDVRSHIYKDAKEIEKDINNKWQYDPDRPNKQVAIVHGEGANIHMHLQVHPNSIFIKDKE